MPGCERAHELLERVVQRGFFCSTIMLRDPWLDPVRNSRRFSEIVARAEERSRDAEMEFRRLGGDKILAD